MKAKERSVRTMLDSVDLMRHRERSRRRREAAAALFVAAGGLGLAALLASGGAGSGSVLAEGDSQGQTQADSDHGIPTHAVSGQVSAAVQSGPATGAAVSGNAGPNGAGVSGGANVPGGGASGDGSVDNPTNPFDTLPPPIDSGGGGEGGDDNSGDDEGGGGASPTISASLGLSASEDGASVSAGASVAGVLAAHAEAGAKNPNVSADEDEPLSSSSLLGGLLD